MKRSNFLPVLFCSLMACNSNHQETNDHTGPSNDFDIQQGTAFLDSANTKFTEAIRNGDTTAIGAFYSPDAELLLPNSEAIKTENIPAVFGEAIRMGLKHFTFKSTNVTGSGEFMVNTGTYEMKTNDMALIDQGKFVVVWRRYNGQWKIFRDIGNTNIPATPIK